MEILKISTHWCGLHASVWPCAQCEHHACSCCTHMAYLPTYQLATSNHLGSWASGIQYCSTHAELTQHPKTQAWRHQELFNFSQSLLLIAGLIFFYANHHEHFCIGNNLQVGYKVALEGTLGQGSVEMVTITPFIHRAEVTGS